MNGAVLPADPSGDLNFDLARALSGQIGDRFLVSLVKHLAGALSADFAFVGEVDPFDRSSIRTVAVVAGGHPAPNFEYGLEGTPCQDVANQSLCVLRRDVQRLYPEDLLLAEMGIEGYIGTPLLDSHGESIGLMVLLFRSEIVDPELARSLLEMFASRAAAELERTRAEAALRASEAELRARTADLEAVKLRLEMAAESAALALWEIDVATGTVTATARLAEIIGAPSGETMGVDFLRRAVPPDDQARVLAALEEHIAGRTELFEVENRLQRPSGEEVWTLSRGRAVERDPGGRAIRICGTTLDVTRSKQMEEHLRQAQKIESVGRLAAGVAHDFNNLLTPILGYAQLLQGSLPPESREHALAFEIKHAAERSRDLAKQILALSRPRTIEPKLIDLREVIHDAERLLRRTIRESIELKVELPSDPCWVIADPSQIEQLLINLAVNSQDAMPLGGALSIQVEPGEDVWILSVSDTGHGMNEATVARIFEPFFSTKGDLGTGLGLATAKGIVEKHDGTISVSSELGKGTSFEIVLPRAAGAPATSADAAAEAPARAAGGTILVAEDDRMVRRLIGLVLTEAGCTVLSAATGDEALELAEQHTGMIDLVLADLTLPDMTGTELTDRIAAVRPNIPALLMSGYPDSLAETGRFHHIQKPFTIEALTAKVRRLLSGP